MRKIYIAILAVLICSETLQAQVNHKGQPFRWGTTSQSDNVAFVQMPTLDMETIREQDRESDKYKEFSYRFGIERTVDLNTENSGVWSSEGEMNIWRLGIHAPNAKAISLLFNEFEIPKSARLFIYDMERTHFIGAFNYTNQQANGMLATSLVYSENVIVELQIPADRDLSNLNLSIGQIVHAYRGPDSEFEELKAGDRDPFGSSGSCNIGTNCPEANEWQVEKQSVALITSGGSTVCTGALVNNTANDGHPYFLTANHCLGGGVGNWVFYFNHEAATCEGSSGPTNTSVSGAIIVANNANSDFGLLEINNGDAIPANFNAEYAGWDNSDSEAAVTASIGIHHPSGDVKKICFDDDGATFNNQGGAEVWFIDQWEEGVTEQGSSGSPLFNQDHRVIGQLYGGGAACAGNSNNGQPDWYGRFGVSWDGSSASTRLRDWLDPQNTGVTTIDGWPTGAVSYDFDAASSGLEDVPEELCEPSTVQPTFVLKNNGINNLTSCVITYSYNGGNDQTINWSGNLVEDATEDVQLASFTAIAGTNTVTVTVSSPNGETDENVNNNSVTRSFDLTIGSEELRIRIKTDNYGYETYWEVRGPNNQLLGSGGNTNVGANGGGNQIAGENDPGAYGNNTTAYDTVQLVGDGCYTFLIVDDFGDGICCGGTGNGNYRLRDINNTTLMQGGEFSNDEESTVGMATGLSVSEVNFGQLSIYPNPARDLLYVEVENAEELNSISITDIVGRTVAEQPTTQQKTVMDLGRLAKGVYNVILNSDNGTATKKIVLID